MMDKTEAIMRIKDHIRVHHIGEYPHIKIGEALNMAMSALASDNNVGSKWIPVTERLPEEEELVLIICKNGARFVGYYKRVYYSDEISWGIKTALNSTRWLNKGRVTHWIPLPESPRDKI